MPKRQPHPDLATFAQWRMESESVADDFFKDVMFGDAMSALRMKKAYADGYLRGRLHQWRLEQELALFRARLDQLND